MADIGSALLRDIKSLCLRVHGEDWIPGWEFVLWRAAIGQCKIDKIGFDDLARILQKSREAKGWYTRSTENGWRFIPLSDWLPFVRNICGKQEDEDVPVS